MERKNFRISQIPSSVRDQLKTIAKNSNYTMSGLMRPKIRELIDSFPEHLKTPNDNTGKVDMKITGVQDSLISELDVISKNLGVTSNDLLRLKINQVIENTPKNLRVKWD